MRGSIDLIATGFVADLPNQASDFPSAGGDSSKRQFQAVYWRCITVFLYSARLTNPDRRIVLFSNVPPPTVDGVDLAEIFEALDTEQVVLPLTHRLPSERAQKWGNVFYFLDILEWLRNQAANLRLCLLDSDVVVTGSLDMVFDTLGNADLGFLPIDYPVDHVVNGITRREIASLAANCPPDTLRYFGGEILAIDVETARRLDRTIESTWQEVFGGSGEISKVRTEEHFWSLLVAREQIAIAELSDSIKRMWTSLRYRNVTLGDQVRPLWHLPAEKRYGIVDLFHELRRRRFALDFSPEAFAEMAGRRCGIPTASPGKRFRDTARRIAHKVQA